MTYTVNIKPRVPTYLLRVGASLDNRPTAQLDPIWEFHIRTVDEDAETYTQDFVFGWVRPGRWSDHHVPPDPFAVVEGTDPSWWINEWRGLLDRELRIAVKQAVHDSGARYVVADREDSTAVSLVTSRALERAGEWVCPDQNAVESVAWVEALIAELDAADVVIDEETARRIARDRTARPGSAGEAAAS